MNRLMRPVCVVLGCSHPIVLAATGKVRRADRIALVSEEGGFSLVDMAAASPELIGAEITRLSRLSNRCFGVIFNPVSVGPALLAQQIRTAVGLGVTAIAFSSDPEPGTIRELSSRGVIVVCAVSTTKEARAAEKAGARVLIAPFVVPGGEASLAGIVAATTLPILASGNTNEAKNVARALALGADGVVITSPESFLPLLTEAGQMLGPEVARVSAEPATFASPVCYLAELDDATAGFADREELIERFNAWLETARVGVRLLPEDATEVLWCGVLESAILALEGSPSRSCAPWLHEPDALTRLARERENRASEIAKLLPRVRSDAIYAALHATLAKQAVS